MRVDLSIIIVSYNAKPYLEACLLSIVNAKLKITVETIVVDNNSTDGSADIVREHFPWCRLITNTQNLGFSRANNQGILKAKGRYLLLLNNDTEVIGDCLQQLVDFMDMHDDAGIAGCKVLNPDGSVQSSCFSYPTFMTELSFFSLGIIKDILNPLRRHKLIKDLPTSEPVTVPWVSGCFMLIRRSVIDQVGNLNENIFLFYEDTEFCRRVLEHSQFKIYYCPVGSIIHYKGKAQPALITLP